MNFFKKIFISSLIFFVLFSFLSKSKVVYCEDIKYNILVDLNECKLFLINASSKKIIKEYPIAKGKRETPSPVGTWKVTGKGAWSEGFGTRWMGLNVPWGKYGIHGTNRPSTIGGSVSHGCIRMFNEDVEDLYKYVQFNTTVVIYGGPYNQFYNQFRTLVPGDRGPDVYEVQRQMENAGYYNGKLDGIYGEGMKSMVIKFRQDHHLPISHDIDDSIYNKLNMMPFE